MHPSRHYQLPKRVPQRLTSRRRQEGGPSVCMILSVTLTNGLLLLVLFECWFFGMLQTSSMPKITDTPVFLHKVRRPNGTKSPILVVGLPKAGTSSLFEFFHCQGFRSQHWYCCGRQDRSDKGGPHYMSDCMIHNLQHQLPILDGCGNYDVFTELNGPRRNDATGKVEWSSQDNNNRPRIFLPQHYHLQELHDFAPTSTWILNLRPVDEWVHSVLQVPGNALTRQLIHEVQSHQDIPTPNGRNQTMQFLEDFWKRHVQRVHDFCKTHPSHKLVVVNITHPNAAIDLGKSLGWNNSTLSASACWGQHNLGEYHQENNRVSPKRMDRDRDRPRGDLLVVQTKE